MPVSSSALTMINLCNLSYGSAAGIHQAVSDYNPNLQVIWGPVEYTPPGAYESVSLIYIVKGNIVSNSGNEYTVVIRGTNMLSWDSWEDEDFDTGVQVGFNRIVSAAPPAAKIARGTYTGMNFLMNHSTNARWPIPPQDTLKRLGRNLQYLNVTGHSLGGTLVAPYFTYILNYLLPELRLPLGNCQPFSFAGLTPGNAAFNTYFGRHYTSGLQWRYVNPLDIAPNCWWSKRNIEKIYEPYVKWYDWATLRYGVPEDILVNRLFSGLPAAPDNYVQPPGEVLLPESFNSHVEYLDWILQAMYQHHGTTYLSLMTATVAAESSKPAKKTKKKPAPKKQAKKAPAKKAAKKTAKKAPVKKAVKKVVKKATAKKPVKKAAPKKAVKKTIKKAAPKKQVKKAVKKSPVKKSVKRKSAKKK